MIEIQDHAVARTLDEHTHSRAAFQHQARAFGAAIQISQQSSLESLSSLDRVAIARVVR
jgi:hypothetical protein